MRTGLLVNPSSARSGGKGDRLIAELGEQPHLVIHRLQRFADLRLALEEFARARIELLAVSSGDGTIQSVQTELGERNPFATLPQLCLLAHGTTNMTAADIGFTARSLSAQAAFLRAPKITRAVSRAALRIANPADGQPRHGMFLGAGAVTAAVRFCQAALNRRGIGGNLAPALTLAAALGASWFSRTRTIDQPADMTVSGNGKVQASGPQLLLLASTLERLILGARPFWGGAAGDLRVTVLPYPTPNKLRWLRPMLYGGETRNAPPGAVSFSAANFSVESVGDFVLDGEFFTSPDDAPLKVETGIRLSYIQA